jgi:hypothetical protein
MHSISGRSLVITLNIRQQYIASLRKFASLIDLKENEAESIPFLSREQN